MQWCKLLTLLLSFVSLKRQSATHSVEREALLVLGSSMAERPAVNRVVVSSNLTRAAGVFFVSK
jgi:hypothetical protein